MTHQDFVTLTRGLNRNSPPMRLFEKAKNLGTWNPSDLDFSDESRHIAYGLYLLSSLIAEDKRLCDALERKMNTLLPQAVMVVSDIFDSYQPMPFGLIIEEYVDFAVNQFSKRFARLEKARDATLEEINQSTAHFINQET